MYIDCNPVNDVTISLFVIGLFSKNGQPNLTLLNKKKRSVIKNNKPKGADLFIRLYYEIWIIMTCLARYYFIPLFVRIKHDIE